MIKVGLKTLDRLLYIPFVSAVQVAICFGLRMAFNSIIFCLVAVASNIHTANLLHITNFYVPRRAYNQVEIDCKYDVEGRQLYDVKWYKDEKQFFRCANDGTVQEFPVEGVMIRHSDFATVGSCPLTLIALSPKSVGEYRCEVSLDQPDFPMVFKSSRLDLLMPARRVQDSPDLETQGTEKHTAEEENEIKSSGSQKTEFEYFVILLFSFYFIFT